MFFRHLVKLNYEIPFKNDKKIGNIEQNKLYFKDDFWETRSKKFLIKKNFFRNFKNWIYV